MREGKAERTSPSPAGMGWKRERETREVARRGREARRAGWIPLVVSSRVTERRVEEEATKRAWMRAREVA